RNVRRLSSDHRQHDRHYEVLVGPVLDTDLRCRRSVLHIVLAVWLFATHDARRRGFGHFCHRTFQLDNPMINAESTVESLVPKRPRCFWFRCAVSTFCALVTVALCVLWVRSNWWSDDLLLVTGHQKTFAWSADNYLFLKVNRYAFEQPVSL